MSTIYVTVPGRIATKPERLTSKNGTGVWFRVASTERWFNRTAEAWNEAEPVYLKVTCWRQLAESVLVSLRIGDPVIVHGKLINSSFERDGRIEHRLEISAGAVGPDLRWSTAVVTRTKAAGADAPPGGGADAGTPSAAATGPSGEPSPADDTALTGGGGALAGEDRDRRMRVPAGEGAVRV
jgi:single-strand DNA-binding protein